MSVPAYLTAPEPIEAFYFREAKLEAPRPRRGKVIKRALLHKLCTTRDRALLVTAPPGYGKTTLLAEWANRDRRRFAWLTADTGDDDGTGLVTYLAAAASRAGVDCTRVFPAVAGGASPSSAAALLARSVAELEEPIVVVVDNAHTLTSEASREVVIAVLDALGEGSQLVLSGRRSTLFARRWFAARYAASEVGIAELRLTAEEAGLLLRGAGLDLAETQVEELNRRVEGWPAALYLAALSLLAQRAEGVSEPEFSGADRLMADYARLEVLGELSLDELALVKRTAFLEQVDRTLADEVLDAGGAGTHLESLATRTGLVTATAPEEEVAQDRRSFRLHNVLRELLVSELDREEPDLLATLAGRASAFYERSYRTNGGNPFDADCAIRYARDAGDDERMISLIETAEPHPHGGPRLEAYRASFGRLDSETVLAAHPKVAMLGAWVHALSGEDNAAEREVLIGDDGWTSRSSTPACVNAVRAWICAHGLDGMQPDAEAAIRATDAGDPWHATALIALGVAELFAGNLLRADRVFRRAAADANVSETPDELATALTELALIALENGESAAAESLVRDGLDVVRSAKLTDHPTTALTHATSARVAVQSGDMRRAERDVERAMPTLARLTPALPWLSAQARLELARVHFALCDYAATAARLAEVGAVLRRVPVLGTVSGSREALEEELHAAREPIEGWPATLTAAERRLLPLLATHRTFREIAADLGISRNTVKTQAISVYRKLRVTSRSEAVGAALELGLLDEPHRPLTATA